MGGHHCEKITRNRCGKDVKVIRDWQRQRKREKAKWCGDTPGMQMVPKRDRDRACHPHGAIEHVGNLGWLSFGVGSRKNPDSVGGIPVPAQHILIF